MLCGSHCTQKKPDNIKNVHVNIILACNTASYGPFTDHLMYITHHNGKNLVEIITLRSCFYRALVRMGWSLNIEVCGIESSKIVSKIWVDTVGAFVEELVWVCHDLVSGIRSTWYQVTVIWGKTEYLFGCSQHLFSWQVQDKKQLKKIGYINKLIKKV